MNTWAQWLRDSPATLQRLIARHNRISLPRVCTPEERLTRLRAALIHQRTVRVTYFSLDAAARAAVDDLRTHRFRIRADWLEQTYGPIRPLKQMLSDPTPQSLSERLLLLGWLLPRPATRNHPPVYLMPPDVREWLPRPLAPETFGPAAPPPVAPAVHAAAVLLTAISDHPLAVREDGLLRQSSLRHLRPRLAPALAETADDLYAFLLPLLYQLALAERRDGQLRPTVAASRFLSRPLAEQQARLHQTWIGLSTPDPWLRRLLIPDQGERGIDWPVLRRRLCAWAAALPHQQLVALTGLHAHLVAALGPLADAHTHGYRPVSRTPWNDTRAEAIFTAALRGPLCWLGLVAWDGADRLARVAVLDAVAPPDLPADFTLPTEDDADPQSPIPDPQSPLPWTYGPPGEVIIPYTSAQAPVLRLLPFATWSAADAESSTYRITRPQIAHAAHQGWSDSVLWRLLEQQAGPPPADWIGDLHDEHSRLRLRQTGVLIADDPAVLNRAAENRNVRRYLETRIAPGIALVPPEHMDRLVTALARQDITIDDRRDDDTPPPHLPGAHELTAAECATLLISSAFYRQYAPPEASHLPHADLEGHLRAALTPALRQAVDAALNDLPAPGSVTAQQVAAQVTLAEQRVQRADAQRATAERRAQEWERRARQAEEQLANLQPQPKPAPAPPMNDFWTALSDGDQGPGIGDRTSEEPVTNACQPLCMVPDNNVAISTHAAMPDPSPVPATPAPPPLRVQTPRPALPAVIAVLILWWTLLLTLLPGVPVQRRRPSQPPILDLQPPTHDPPAAPPVPEQHPAHACALTGDPLPLLRRAIARRHTLEVAYDTGGRGSIDTRLIRPLYLEAHGPVWYLRVYCPRHHAERTFRVDRLQACTVVGGRPRRGDPEARRWRKQWPVIPEDGPPPAPPPRSRRSRERASFFPPGPEPGKSRVWLEEG